MPQIGDIAPDFELPNQDGKRIHLSDFRGKRVVLFAFTKAGTAGCTAQSCNLRDEFDELSAANAVVLAVSTDSQEALTRFKQNRRLPYDLLSDPKHEMLEAWGAYGTPLIGLIKLPMTLHSLWVIDEHGVVADAQVRLTEGAAQRALRALNRLPTPQDVAANAD